MHTHHTVFKYYDAAYQYMFFKNTVWMVTGDGIKESGRIIDSGFIPPNLLLEHNVELQQPAFKIFEKPDGGFDIETLHENCIFFNFLVQTSRIRFNQERAALITSQGGFVGDIGKRVNISSSFLTEKQQDDQKQILIAKIFALGYLMHRYKDRAQARAVVVHDQMLMNNGITLGGTGKSLCFVQALSKVLKTVFHLPGTNPLVIQNPHMFHGLTKDNALITIDDMRSSFKPQHFFEAITGDISVNPQMKRPYTIPFEESAKLLFIYDDYPKLADPSVLRRVIPVVFSDYYHNQNEEYGYSQAFTPKDDFGKNLFVDFTEDDYSHFFTTMANCLTFKLSAKDIYVKPPKPIEA